MAHASTTRFPLLTFLSLTYPIKHHRISLRKGRGEQRVAKIYDSPCLPEVLSLYLVVEYLLCRVRQHLQLTPMVLVTPRTENNNAEIKKH